MKTWRLQDQLWDMVNKWPSLLAFVVGAGLLGYLGSLLFSPAYRAEADLFVGIDVRRVGEMAHVIPLAKTEPLNLDDYKNWQLKQVADIVQSEQILEKSLERLKLEGSRWDEENLKDFQQRVDIYWYDAGTWHLQVTHPQREMAEEAVRTWREVAQNRLMELITYGERAAEVEGELRVYVQSLAALKEETALLDVLLQDLEEWETEMETLEGQESIPDTTRDEIQLWLESYRAGQDLSWLPMLSDEPEISTPEEYLRGLGDIETLALLIRESLDAEQTILNQEREALLGEYHQAQDQSLGLSGNLNLEILSSTPRVERVRYPGLMTLVSGGLGFLFWMIFVFLQGRAQGDDR